jgi:hypothetical protein
MDPMRPSANGAGSAYDDNDADDDDDYLEFMGGVLEEVVEDDGDAPTGGPPDDAGGASTPPLERRTLAAALGHSAAAATTAAATAAAPAAAAPAQAAAGAVPADVAYVVHLVLSTAVEHPPSVVGTVLSFVFAGRGLGTRTVLARLPFVELRQVRPEPLARLRAPSLPPPLDAGARAALDAYFPPPAAADAHAAFSRVVRVVLTAAPAAAARGFTGASADGWLGAGSLGTLLRNLGWKDALHGDSFVPLLRALPFVEVDTASPGEARYRLRRGGGGGAVKSAGGAAAIRRTTFNDDDVSDDAGDDDGGTFSTPIDRGRGSRTHQVVSNVPQRLAAGVRAALEEAKAARRLGAGWHQGGDIGLFLAARGLKKLVAETGHSLEDVVLSLPFVHHARDERRNAWYRLRVPEDAAGAGPPLPAELRRLPPMADKPPAYTVSSLSPRLVAAAYEVVGADWISSGNIASLLGARNVLQLVPDIGRKGAVEACLRALPRLEWRRNSEYHSYFRQRTGGDAGAPPAAAPIAPAPAPPARSSYGARDGAAAPGGSLSSVVRAILRDLAAARRFVDADGWVKASVIGSELKTRGVALPGALNAALQRLPGVEAEFDAAACVLYVRLPVAAAAAATTIAAPPPRAAPAAGAAAVAGGAPASRLPPTAMAAAQRAVREALFAAGGDHVYGPELQAAVAAALAEHAVDAAAGGGDGADDGAVAGGRLAGSDDFERLVDVLLEMPDVVTQRSGSLLRAAFRE